MFHRHLVALVSVCLLTVHVLAQGPPPPPMPVSRDWRPSPTGTAAIRGRIVAADTGRPLRRVRISISAPELNGTVRTTSTNPDGRYEIANLPSGRYTIRATRSGYLGLQYGQRRPFELGTPVQIADKETIDRVDLALPRASSVRGRITDEGGEPIADVVVAAMRTVYSQGRKRLMPSGAATARTDEDGEYRLGGLVPGTYFIVASARETWTVTVDGVEQRMAYGLTYFPGAAASGDARAVTVGISQATAGVDFAMIPGRTARVSGTASDSRGPLASREILLTQGIGGAATGAQTLLAAAATSKEGAFSFDSVQPGQYKLQARSFVPSKAGGGLVAEVGTVPIETTGVDLTDVSVAAMPGWTASGRLVAEGGTLPDDSRDRFRIGATLVDADAAPSPPIPPPPPGAGVFESGRVREDWTFSVTNIFGAARIRADVPEGWMVKAVQHEGRDVSDAPFDLKSGEDLSGLEVVVTPRITTVTGRLTDARGAAVRDGTVILFASDPSKWFEESRWIRAVRPDQEGRYQIKGLPPGEYLAVAIDYVEDGMWNDAEYLESIRRTAQKLTLASGESHALPLRLTGR